MNSIYRLGLVNLIFFCSLISQAQNTFQSVQTGNWDDASTWRTGAGAGGSVGIDYPAPTDDVYIATGDTVYLNIATTGTLYQFEGYLEVDTAAILWVTVGDNNNGLSLEANARLYNRGRVYTGLANEGPGTAGPYEIDIYLEDNSIYYAYTGSFNYCSDDIHIRGNAIFFAEPDVCVEIDDDFHLNGTNSLMCGSGGASIGLQTAANEVIYEAGASATNICNGLVIYRGAGATCDPTSGTAVVTGTGPTNLRPRAVNDNPKTAQNTALNISVLYFGLDDVDLDGATLEILQVGSNAAINDNASAAGGTLSINDNGTPANFADDYVVYTPPAGFLGGDSFQYIIEDDDGATDTATVSITVACGNGSLTTYSYTYATYESDANAVVNATSAAGAPDGAFAQIDNNNQTLTVDLGQVFTAGTQYEIVWRRKNSVGAGTAIIDLSESTAPASGFTNHPVSPENTDNVAFTTTVVTSNVDFRYIAFDKGNSSTVDYEIDAVGVRSGVSCDLDTDEDGIANSIDVDDDNDGILDVDELDCTTTATGPSGPVVANAGTGGSLALINDGDLTADNGIALNGAGEYIVVDLGANVPSGTDIVFTLWKNLDNNKTLRFAQLPNATPNLGGGTNPSTINDVAVATGGAVTSFTYTLDAETRYVQVEMTSRNGGRIEVIEATVQSYTVCVDLDTDNDGISNSLDLDSDGDGIPDIVEAGGIDANGDGKVDVFIDTDNDGLADIFDTDDGGTALSDLDTDSDGIKNRNDIDSDGDGIVDVIEAQSSNASPTIPSGTDSDNDGIDDAFDIDFGGSFLIPVNTDEADNPDYLDGDSDNDGVTDLVEAYDTDLDNISDTDESGVDTDGDGLDDAFDLINGANTTTNITNTQTSSSFPNDDNASTTERDWREFSDNDGDGIADEFDTDDDNDGILDVDECSNLVFAGGFDNITGLSLGNNIGEDISPWVNAGTTNVIFVDGPGGATYGIGGPEFDARGGAGNYYDVAGASGTIYQTFTLTTTTLVRYHLFFSARDGGSGDVEASILAGTGTGGAVQSTFGTLTTSDNVNWQYESNRAVLMPGTYTYLLDIDNFINVDEASISTFCDTDGDGILNQFDLDSDNDGITDIIEAGGVDADSDGRVDDNTDTDGDGFADVYDSNDGGAEISDPDTDGDGIPNRIDVDSDNDGIIDAVEVQFGAFVAPSGLDVDNDGIDDAYDANNGGIDISPNNQDASGDPDYLSLDSDGDGLFDWSEGYDDNLSGDALDDMILRADNFEIAAGNPLFYINADDADADGVPNWLEDDDADNLLNFLDPDNGFYQDTDNDGLVDLFDTDNFGAAANLPDSDADGLPDFRDLDDQISLPVELLYYTAVKTGNVVRLDWVTLTEINNDYFTVERSVDGTYFTELARISGHGNTADRKEYIFTDLNPNLGKNYYRLRQTDFDGKETIEGIRWVTFDAEDASEFKLHPNPNEGQLIYLNFNSQTASSLIGISIYDTKGDLQYEKLVNQFFEENELIRLELTIELSPGIYLVVLNTAQQSYTRKLIVR